MSPAPLDGRRSVLQRRIRLIVAVTISYNLIEAIVAVSAGTEASSVALIGFGLDSTIQVLSVIVGFAIHEGIEAWKGGACATSVAMILDNDQHHDEHERHQQ